MEFDEPDPFTLAANSNIIIDEKTVKLIQQPTAPTPSSGIESTQDFALIIGLFMRLEIVSPAPSFSPSSPYPELYLEASLDGGATWGAMNTAERVQINSNISTPAFLSNTDIDVGISLQDASVSAKGLMMRLRATGDAAASVVLQNIFAKILLLVT